MKLSRGVCVYSTDGGVTWKTAVYPYQGDLGSINSDGIPNGRTEGIDYFLGGHTYPITSAQATTLTSAGFGAYIS